MSVALLLPSPRTVSPRSGTLDVGVELARDVTSAIAAPDLLSGSRPGLALRLGALAIPHAEGYRLDISTGGIAISARDPAGASHALRTLSQLLRLHPTSLPAQVIDDFPAFPNRGVMLDISRNKVPTMASLRDAIDLFAAVKFNHLQLYTEHTFAYAGHDDAWDGASPITPDEARDLDAYCQSRGIDLAPNQNCFGHLSSWLNLPRYAHLAETHGPWKFLDHDRSGPFSLCPIDDRSVEFVRGLLSQLLPCFRSGLVNIGCDETFDVGFGRSAAQADKRGRAAVYFEFVSKVAEIARSLGKRPMMWADIALNHPESLGLFPKDAIGLAWGYEPDAPFANWCDRLREHNIEPWVCPGTSSWRSITGRTTERNANLAAAAMQGLAHGATGYLATDWGDSGHHQHWPIVLAALARAAQAAWNPDGLATFDPRALSLHAFKHVNWSFAGAAIGPWLDRLGDLDLPLRQSNSLRNNSALFMDLHRGYGSRPIAASPDDLRDVAARLDDLDRTAPSAANVGQLVADELAHTLLTARLALTHAVTARRPGGPGATDLADLTELLQRVVAEHCRLWPLRNRPGGLTESCSHYQRILARLSEPPTEVGGHG